MNRPFVLDPNEKENREPKPGYAAKPTGFARGSRARMLLFLSTPGIPKIPELPTQSVTSLESYLQLGLCRWQDGLTEPFTFPQSKAR